MHAETDKYSLNDEDSELLVHSSCAFSVYKDFKENDFTILVEGKDDVGFWEFIFEKVTGLSFSVEPLGCKNEVKKKISDLSSGRLKNTILAMDMDYDFESIELHRDIVFTKGYSIENTLVNKDSLCSVIDAYGGGGLEIVKRNVCTWLDKIYLDMEELIVLDVIGSCEREVGSVIKDSHSCLLKDKKSINICPKKRSIMAGKIGSVSNDEISSMKARIGKMKVEISSLLKGHLLLSLSNNFAVNYLNNMKKDSDGKISISSKNFFAMLMLCFKNSFNDRHPEFDFYKDKISSSEVIASVAGG